MKEKEEMSCSQKVKKHNDLIKLIQESTLCFGTHALLFPGKAE